MARSPRSGRPRAAPDGAPPPPLGDEPGVGALADLGAHLVEQHVAGTAMDLRRHERSLQRFSRFLIRSRYRFAPSSRSSRAACCDYFLTDFST